MTRILAVDMGNSFTKYALIEDGQIKANWRHPTADTQTAADAILAQCDAQVVLSTVVPDQAAHFDRICSARGRSVVRITSQAQSIITGTSGELGADLLAAAVAARKLYAPSSDLIVVGLGTANTMTKIFADGRFGGVHITLGMTATLDELARRCALVPQFKERLSGIAPGFTTEDAVLGGTLLFQVGGVEAWIARSRQDMGGKAVTVASGGWSTAIAQNTNAIDHVDAELVLKGIYFLYEAMQPSVLPGGGTQSGNAA